MLKTSKKYHFFIFSRKVFYAANKFYYQTSYLFFTTNQMFTGVPTDAVEERVIVVLTEELQLQSAEEQDGDWEDRYVVHGG